MQTSSDTQQPVGSPTPFNTVDAPVTPDIEVTETTELAPTTTDDGGAATDAAEAQAKEEARKHGWVDQDEWRGPPERWRPASEFLDVRSNVLSLVREENSQLRAKLAALDMKVNQREQREAEDRAKLTRESMRIELKNARENQDWDKVDEITEKLIDGKLATVAPRQQAPQIDPNVRETFNQYTEQNKWLLTDKGLASNFAIELKAVVDAGAAPDMISAMNVAKDRVMRLYPEKFRANGARRTTGMVDMGGTPGGSSNGRGWNDLQPDIRKQAEDDIQKKKYTKEDFLSNCDAEHFRR